MNSSQNKSSLLDNLTAYSRSDYYPFHMPGHKRAQLSFPNPWSVDITEIDGFDNLHHANGILQELQERAAKLFGAKRSFCLVNGSTCGILAAISACVKPGGKLLLSRNCHKSAYHGIYLRNLTPVYVMPEMTDFGIMGSLSPKAVALALEAQPDIQAVLVVSPTYDGVVSDIRSIAEIAHKHNIPLIVDEAHGAHLPLIAREPIPSSPDGYLFPPSALSCGADIVIHSLHKTLPSFTQTALLHVNSDLVDNSVLQRFLGIYQSSSPSYLLMASMDQCFQIIESQGSQLFSDFHRQLMDFYEVTSRLTHIRLFTGANEKNCFAHDPSKLLISAEALGLSGQELYRILLEKYHLQLEMASGHYVLALTSLMDRPEGFRRLYHALAEIERQQGTLDLAAKDAPTNCNTAANHNTTTGMISSTRFLSHQELYRLPKQVMTISDALERPGTAIALTEAAGFVSQEYLYLYPPGIPLLAPGEEIDETLLRHVKQIKAADLPLEGLADQTNTQITVVTME